MHDAKGTSLLDDLKLKMYIIENKRLFESNLLPPVIITPLTCTNTHAAWGWSFDSHRYKHGLLLLRRRRGPAAFCMVFCD